MPYHGPMRAEWDVTESKVIVSNAHQSFVLSEAEALDLADEIRALAARTERRGFVGARPKVVRGVAPSAEEPTPPAGEVSTARWLDILELVARSGR